MGAKPPSLCRLLQLPPDREMSWRGTLQGPLTTPEPPFSVGKRARRKHAQSAQTLPWSEHPWCRGGGGSDKDGGSTWATAETCAKRESLGGGGQLRSLLLPELICRPGIEAKQVRIPRTDQHAELRIYRGWGEGWRGREGSGGGWGQRLLQTRRAGWVEGTVRVALLATGSLSNKAGEGMPAGAHRPSGWVLGVSGGRHGHVQLLPGKGAGRIGNAGGLGRSRLANISICATHKVWSSNRLESRSSPGGTRGSESIKRGGPALRVGDLGGAHPTPSRRQPSAERQPLEGGAPESSKARGPQRGALSVPGAGSKIDPVQ